MEKIVCANRDKKIQKQKNGLLSSENNYMIMYVEKVCATALRACCAERTAPCCLQHVCMMNLHRIFHGIYIEKYIEVQVYEFMCSLKK